LPWRLSRFAFAMVRFAGMGVSPLRRRPFG
jgi:hypothetical protein